MNSIRKLPQSVINQIAAGELIDSPASIIKELVENSIDSGATEIKLFIRNGGKSYVRIEDNGCGMDKKDLSICMECHTTSKLKSDDLYDISSLGFRGEALFSICSCAFVNIKTKKKHDNAYEVNVDNGVKSDISQCFDIFFEKNSFGTIIEVTKLFFAIPARRNFLNSNTVCKKEIQNLVFQFGLQYFGIKIELYDDDKCISCYEKQNNFEDRVYEFIADLKPNSTTFFNSEIFEDQKYEAFGVISVPTFNKPSNFMQYPFINGRFIRNSFVLFTINNLYRDYVPMNRYPVFCLYLNIPACEIDLNVHPKKNEIKFKNQQRIKSFLVNSITPFLQKITHASRFQNIKFDMSLNDVDLNEKKSFDNGFGNGFDGKNVNKYLSADLGGMVKNENRLIYQKKLNDQKNLGYERKLGYDKKLSQNSNDLRDADYVNNANNIDNSDNSNNLDSTSNSMKNIIQNVVKDIPSVTHGNFLFEIENIYSQNFGTAILQIFNSYIMSNGDDCIFIIDQHAAHERVNYEVLKKKILVREKMPAQKMLVPIEFELNESIADKDVEMDMLLSLGFEIKVENKLVKVSMMPSILQKNCNEKFVQEMFEEIFYIKSEYEKFHSIIAYKIDKVCGSIACHASIKAGQKLSIDEMNSLIQQMEVTPNIGQCNHGRPTHVRLSKKSLDDVFER